MACSVQRRWCEPRFHSKARGSLRGRAGAFLPRGSGLEEEAGEGEGEDGEVQAKAREEAPQVQQPEVLSCKYRKLRKSCTSQLSNCKMIAKSCQECRKKFRSVMSLSRPFMYFFTFDEVSSSRLQICPQYIFGNYPPQMVPIRWI